MKIFESRSWLTAGSLCPGGPGNQKCALIIFLKTEVFLWSVNIVRGEKLQTFVYKFFGKINFANKFEEKFPPD